jgi:hypothetical protein
VREDTPGIHLRWLPGAKREFPYRERTMEVAPGVAGTESEKGVILLFRKRGQSKNQNDPFFGSRSEPALDRNGHAPALIDVHEAPTSSLSIELK